MSIFLRLATIVIALCFAAPRSFAQASAFCYGDGSQTPGCPCANSGMLTAGCANSAGAMGAHLSTMGTTSPDTIMFMAMGEPASALSIVYQSDTRRGGAMFGDGLQCLSGTLRKMYVKNASVGMVVAPEAGDLSVTQRSAALGDPIPAGGFRYYHVQYRDPAPAFCAAPIGGTWNVTNAMMIHW